MGAKISCISPLVKTKLPWGHEQHQVFDNIKKIISEEVILTYPDFDKEFLIHVDAIDTQLCPVVSQNNKSIAFFSRKLSPTQQKYNIGEREMLSVVKTLLEFRNTLLGYKIKIFTDQATYSLTTRPNVFNVGDG